MNVADRNYALGPARQQVKNGTRNRYGGRHNLGNSGRFSLSGPSPIGYV